jgi:hypothetical protein
MRKPKYFICFPDNTTIECFANLNVGDIVYYKYSVKDDFDYESESIVSERWFDVEKNEIHFQTLSTLDYYALHK